jgi:hypothetical protein
MRNHHVAEVYEAEDALVVLTSTGPRAHGRRDFVDAPHGAAHHGTPLVDDLDAGPTPTTISRRRASAGRAPCHEPASGRPCNGASATCASIDLPAVS